MDAGFAASKRWNGRQGGKQEKFAFAAIWPPAWQSAFYDSGIIGHKNGIGWQIAVKIGEICMNRGLAAIAIHYHEPVIASTAGRVLGDQ